MWGQLCYYWSYRAYPNSIFYVLSLGLDQFLLAVVQIETRRKQLCLDHVRRVQGVLLPQPGWLKSLCEYLLGKNQEGFPALARESLQLGSPFGATVSSFPRFWLRYHYKQVDYDPIILEKSEIFYLSQVGCPRPGIKLLERGR